MSRVKYGRAELKYDWVLDGISWYFLECLALRCKLTTGVNMSMCRELVAVRRANLSQSFTRRVASRSSPKSSSCRVCDGSHLPVMAAIATLWARSSEWDWVTVRPECHTGQPYSRCTRPSLFQYCTKVCCGTPMALILLMAQVHRVARLTISSH